MLPPSTPATVMPSGTVSSTLEIGERVTSRFTTVRMASTSSLNVASELSTASTLASTASGALTSRDRAYGVCRNL